MLPNSAPRPLSGLSAARLRCTADVLSLGAQNGQSHSTTALSVSNVIRSTETVSVYPSSQLVDMADNRHSARE